MSPAGPGVSSSAELSGRWRRGLFVGPDGSRNDVTDVVWLQTRALYADLRQVPDMLPAGVGVRCLRDLDRRHLEALARQEAFAGELVRHEDHFEWCRSIDFQPPTEAGDRGVLRMNAGMMIEEGWKAPYVEHWHRETPVDVATGAALLWDEARACAGMIVRVGGDFLYARGRTGPPVSAPTLLEAVRSCVDLSRAQDLVDCEVSLGETATSRIARSTLPFRVGETLSPFLEMDHITVFDRTPEGEGYERRWTVRTVEGDLALA